MVYYAKGSDLGYKKGRQFTLYAWNLPGTSSGSGKGVAVFQTQSMNAPKGERDIPLVYGCYTDLPLAGPDQARRPASLPAALLPVDATHVAAVPSQHPSHRRRAPHRCQPHWRVASNWPPPPCPLHGTTQPLPTPVEHTSAHQGGPVFAPATPQPPSAVACGTSAPRLPPRSFR